LSPAARAILARLAAESAAAPTAAAVEDRKKPRRDVFGSAPATESCSRGLDIVGLLVL
jgi:hypothetical protein